MLGYKPLKAVIGPGPKGGLPLFKGGLPAVEAVPRGVVRSIGFQRKKKSPPKTYDRPDFDQTMFVFSDSFANRRYFARRRDRAI